jgi:hypothetical protein
MACDGQLPPDPPAQIINLADIQMAQTKTLVQPPPGTDPALLAQTPFISCIINNESADKTHPQGNDNAIGDKGLANQAYGPLQIRQPCVDDVNRVAGTKYKAADMLGNRPLSIWVFNMYMRIYATQKRLGHTPTDQDRARIWNGGPKGWQVAATQKYYADVVAFAGKQKPPIVLA